MALPTLSSASGPAAWTDVLIRVKEALARAEEEAGLREQRFPPQPLPNTAGRAGAEAGSEFDRRLADLDARADLAGRETREVEAVLHQAEESVRAWLGRASTCAAGLARGTGRRI